LTGEIIRRVVHQTQPAVDQVVDVAGRGLEDLGARALGQAQHVDGAMHASFGRLHGIVLAVDRRGRAGKVVDLVDLDIERERHVVAHQLEARIGQAL
jgi:hypothetical protein